MYIEQVQKNLSDWWRYLIGLVIAVSGVFVFWANVDFASTDVSLHGNFSHLSLELGEAKTLVKSVLKIFREAWHHPHAIYKFAWLLIESVMKYSS